ncbi:MAG TPA: EcsC family protein [Leptolyngbyaceae cyanobacterium]
MTTPHHDTVFEDLVSGAFSAALDMSRAVAEKMRDTNRMMEEAVGPMLYQTIEQGTETVGRLVTPIAESPMVQYATKMPGMTWLMAALGQVDTEKVRQEVADLRQQHPTETAEQLAQRVMLESSWKAAQVGLITNFIPPLAFATAALDIGAVAALQANMIYRIAAIYDFPPNEPARRGEVLAIWGLSSGSSSVLKSGLSIVEMLPGLGAAIGVTADAALLYGVGYLACQFYETKRKGPTVTVRAEDVPTKIEID